MRSEARAEPLGVDPVLAEALLAGWESAGRIVSDLFPVSVTLGSPQITAARGVQLGPRCSLVVMEFSGPSCGIAALLLPEPSARLLTRLLMNSRDLPEAELLSLVPATAMELGNILMNSIVARVGAARGEAYRFDVPSIWNQDRLERRLADGPPACVLQGALEFADDASAVLRMLVHIGSRPSSRPEQP